MDPANDETNKQNLNKRINQLDQKNNELIERCDNHEKTITNLGTKIKDLNLRNTRLEDARNNLQAKLKPLLHETKQFQKEVTKEVERIRLDAELLP